MRASREPFSSPYSATAAVMKSSRHERDASVNSRSRSASSTSGIEAPAGGCTTKCTRAVVDSLMRTLNSTFSPCSRSIRICENRSRTPVL